MRPAALGIVAPGLQGCGRDSKSYPMLMMPYVFQFPFHPYPMPSLQGAPTGSRSRFRLPSGDSSR
eukprot:9486100-Pyramimonas_sp.AAC.1